MRQTTRVFDCWTRLYDVLVASPWPAHPLTGELPPVVFGGTVDVPDEVVIVIGDLAVDTGAIWATLGQPSQDENFAIRVLVQTFVPGVSTFDAVKRLRSLVTVLENAVRDEQTGKPIGGFEEHIVGVLWHHVAQIAPHVVVTPEGTGAVAEVDVAFRCRK